MVGMEKVEVLSKSYLVRWIHVNAGNTISWSLQPHKKSLNFGIFKHPGGANAAPGLPATSSPVIPAETSLQVPSATSDDKKSISDKASKSDNRATLVEKLEALGMKCVSWEGKCEAEKVSIGKFSVMEGEGGMYGLVFDNTFSKQISKTATFVLMTYPTNAPPTSGHHLHFSQASAAISATSLSRPPHSPIIGAAAGSSDSLPHSVVSVSADPRPRSKHLVETKSFGGSTFYTGVMHKRRRKHNSYARRFFSLDFTTGTLSYYRNRHSSALRGAIPLSLAAVAMNDQRREISVDSGAEIWHLKVGNQKDYVGWRDALERASSLARSSAASQYSSEVTKSSETVVEFSIADQQEWQRVEALVGRISGIRDAVRRLAKDTDPKHLPLGLSAPEHSPARSPSAASTEFSREDEPTIEKRPFWKRGISSNASNSFFKRTPSSQLAPQAATASIPIPNGRAAAKRQASYVEHEEDMHEHCIAILRDLDQSVADFTALLNQTRNRRHGPSLQREETRGSMSEDEFFDAPDAPSKSQLIDIRRDSHDLPDLDSLSDDDSDSSLEFEDTFTFSRRRTTDEESALFPSKAKSLIPLPVDSVARRTTVTPPKQAPPSLISFLRKNVGKDLSTIAMPVSANEPTSALQRISEILEYSELLDAASTTSDSNMRLLYIAAFAVSTFSSGRVKERAVRKPFNPMLGETFELVREDKGYRLLTEKISHRPVRMAMQAESTDWTFAQAPLPIQKFWGKSAELNTEGRARVFLHSFSEVYSYTVATSFLRNVIAGEKYIEPVSTMTIVNESTGAKAVVSFKAGGMFAGRSEEVSVQLFDDKGNVLPLGAAGKWTSHLSITNSGQLDTKASPSPLWQVGKLVDDAPKHYGFTTFAAQLNQITDIEKGKLPPTDSRLRPDQRAAEDGEMDLAEAVKAKLEERQRGRRRVMEDHGEEWRPRWFFKAGSDGDEEVWRLKTGRESYWEAREKGDWSGVVDVFET